ncbi:nucleotide pyrophosphohydrolase [Pseudomonas sp. UMAB-40]|uniref:nucleotide pyrophosphohydrolase n=1 Tax=Pseudomonas sp. UMAB-40 TaxID=1365407 RepID=UPI001C57CDE9|nr:nucleotide pyrophosphohydrolase [Pseudomonas sp. UMAB-40]
MSEVANQTDRLRLLEQKVDEFSAARDWEKFHTPKNLSMALTVEAAELMEIFQWLEPQEHFEKLSSKKQMAVEHEVADIFIYLMRFCSVTGIDLISAAEEKLKHNAEKYPAELVKGQSKKYTEYE